MVKNISVQTKLFSAFIVISLVPLLCGAVLQYFSISKHLKHRVIQDMVLVAEAKEGHLYELFQRLQDRSIDFSSDGFIQDQVKKITDKKATKADIKSLNSYLLTNKASLDRTIFGINVLDTSGIVIASTDEREVGKDESNDLYFQETIELPAHRSYSSDVYISHHFGKEEITITFSSALYGRVGEKLGIVILYTTIQELNNVMSGVRQLELGALTGLEGKSKTLEAYLVSKRGYMITESRFVKNSVLVQKIQSPPVEL